MKPKPCMEMPADYKLRPEPLHMLACLAPRGHAGQHQNRLGDSWAPKRTPRPIERVAERRAASW